MFRHTPAFSLVPMGRSRTIKGEVVDHEHPEWDPLRDALLGWFMWMHVVELADGRRVHAYKHRMTRRYLHLTDDERAFVYCGESGYEEIDLEAAIVEVFRTWRPLTEFDPD